MREHEVWAKPPSKSRPILCASFRAREWQWALKYRKVLRDKGYTQVSIQGPAGVSKG